MTTSRRSLIKLGLYASASFLPLVGGVAGRVAFAAEPVDFDTSWLRRDMFEAIVNERFSVQKPQGGSITVRLLRIADVPGNVGSADCFTLLLRESKTASLGQGTYIVESPTLGTFPLFLVPGLRDKTGLTYTAAFNRLPQ